MTRFHAARAGRFVHSGAAMLAVILVLPLSAAEQVHPKYRAAGAAVSEALQREIYGLESERSDLLTAALARSPEFGPARWHSGYIQDAKRGWLKHEAFLQLPKLAARFAAYERQRAMTLDTLAGQLRLADWCAERKLFDQERAHLTRVLDLDSDHRGARERLGFVRAGDQWTSRQEISRDAARSQADREHLSRWRPVLEAIRLGLEHRSQHRREQALVELKEIHSPEAIAAIEQVFAGAADEIVRPAIETLAAMSDPAAAAALAQFAVNWPTAEIRHLAASRLGDRDFDAYVPQLIGAMYTPVVSRIVTTDLPRGRIGYRHAFAREGQHEQQVMLLDTEYRRVRLPGGDRRDSTARAQSDAIETARGLNQAAVTQNRFTAALNQRLVEVLATATRAQLPAQPAAWWDWWNQQNEVFVAGQKPVSIVQTRRSVAIVDQVPTSSGGSQTSDCLAAGTPVWTARGPLAIERIRVGDLVLSQHCETGELAFKPVLRTTVRPSGPLIEVQTSRETFETSGGHLFWVAGDGWKKSRDLQSGQVLHTVSGPVHVEGVETGSEAETYNLVVADFSTYFVGDAKILSHDNTVRTPTRSLVPGLPRP
ncbi:MAG: polymorphic toxin-type HINT domain-containing protein [Pirellulaceae bacterium]